MFAYPSDLLSPYQPLSFHIEVYSPPDLVHTEISRAMLEKNHDESAG